MQRAAQRAGGCREGVVLELKGGWGKGEGEGAGGEMKATYIWQKAAKKGTHLTFYFFLCLFLIAFFWTVRQSRAQSCQ
jgi:hypothetical protein